MEYFIKCSWCTSTICPTCLLDCLPLTLWREIFRGSELTMGQTKMRNGRIGCFYEKIKRIFCDLQFIFEESLVLSDKGHFINFLLFCSLAYFWYFWNSTFAISFLVYWVSPFLSSLFYYSDRNMRKRDQLFITLSYFVRLKWKVFFEGCYKMFVRVYHVEKPRVFNRRAYLIFFYGKFIGFF